MWNGNATFSKVGITGELKSTKYAKVASFIGETESAKVTFNNCYARTELSCSSTYDTGGFICSNGKEPAVITNCYWSGTTNAKTRVGIFRGDAGVDNNYNTCTTNMTVKNSFYNKSLFTLSVPEASSGIGLTTAQMGQQTNYTNWDFKENDEDKQYTWYIDSKTGYPELHF